jgi:hypothetical protein
MRVPSPGLMQRRRVSSPTQFSHCARKNRAARTGGAAAKNGNRADCTYAQGSAVGCMSGLFGRPRAPGRAIPQTEPAKADGIPSRAGEIRASLPRTRRSRPNTPGFGDGSGMQRPWHVGRRPSAATPGAGPSSRRCRGGRASVVNVSFIHPEDLSSGRCAREDRVQAPAAMGGDRMGVGRRNQI